MKYESSILKRLIDTYGVIGNPRYLSEIIKEFIVRGKELYPQLFTYQSDWLAHIDEFGLTPEYTVSYTGQHIYAPNTKEKPVKSAILKGQTLVNLLQNAYISDGIIRNANVSYSKVDTTYTLIYNVTALPTTTTRSTFMVNLSNGTTIYQSTSSTVKHKMGINKWVFKTPTDGTFSVIGYWSNNEDIKLCANNIVLLEGDYTQENIPYFEGMQSVKMPVLTTTGKNLFEIQSWNKDLSGSNSSYVLNDISSIKQRYAYNQQCKIFDGKIHIKKLSNNYIIYDISINNLKANTKYVFSCDFDLIGLSSQPLSGRILNYRNNYFYNGLSQHESMSFTTDSNGSFNMDFINLPIDLNSEIILYNFQLEESSVATSYEPYKTNILSCNEEVELRGIGEVRDTLDLMTGEVSQNLIEFEFNEGDYFASTFTEFENTLRWQTTSPIRQLLQLKTGGKIYSTNFISDNSNDDFEHIRLDGSNPYANVIIYLSKTKASTYEELKTYIKNNPFTIVAEKAEKSIKTVDLTIHDKDLQKVERLTSFEGGTYFTTSSQDGSLLPTLTVDVVTDLEETLMVCSLEGNTM